MRAILVCTLCALSTCLVGCRTPEPRSSEQVMEQARKAPRRPTLLDEVHMPEAQRERIDLLVSELDRDLEDYYRAFRLALAEMVRGVRQGELDRAALAPRFTRAVALLDAKRPRIARFADALHAELDPAQRKRLVELIDGDRSKMTPEERERAEAERVSRIIDFTAGQRTRLYPALFGVMVRHLGPINAYRSGEEEAKEAFVSERFVASELDVFTSTDTMALVEAFLDALDAALGVLEPDQRETLATWMEVELGGRRPTPKTNEPETKAPEAKEPPSEAASN